MLSRLGKPTALITPNHGGILKLIITMVHKREEKELALLLRREGLSYREILAKVPVAKSTLSLWLRSVGLSKRQKQRLTKKKLAAMRRGWAVWHQQRLVRTESIREEARKDFLRRTLNSDALWLTGIVLYWAEGTKEKPHTPGSGIAFNNSDARMIKLFIRWLKEVVHVPSEMIKLELYIHQSGNVDRALRFWSKKVGVASSKIRVYFKRHNPNPKRRNVGKEYNGLLRVAVKRSSGLNRQVDTWTTELCKYWGVD